MCVANHPFREARLLRRPADSRVRFLRSHDTGLCVAYLCGSVRIGSHPRRGHTPLHQEEVETPSASVSIVRPNG